MEFTIYSFLQLIITDGIVFFAMGLASVLLYRMNSIYRKIFFPLFLALTFEILIATITLGIGRSHPLLFLWLRFLGRVIELFGIVYFFWALFEFQKKEEKG